MYNASYDLARLDLTAPTKFWWNSTSFEPPYNIVARGLTSFEWTLSVSILNLSVTTPIKDQLFLYYSSCRGQYSKNIGHYSKYNLAATTMLVCYRGYIVNRNKM